MSRGDLFLLHMFACFALGAAIGEFLKGFGAWVRDKRDRTK